MRYILKFLMIFLFFQCAVYTQNTQKAFYVGHSLSDQIAEMVFSMSESSQGVEFDFAYQSIPGSPLHWNWNHGATFTPNPPHFYGYNHSTGGLPSGTFTTLVLTESVPRIMEYIDETYEYSELFYEYATDFNPNTRVFFYEVWHCINSGTPTGCDYDVDSNPWRQRLTDDLPMWQSVVDNLNNTFNPSTPVCLIPGGQGLARLYDEIELGTVPELTSINDIFTDDIHLSDVGKYFIACIHYATLFGQTPIGLPNQLYGVWGSAFTAPSTSLALRFQEIAWETVTEIPNGCNNTMNISNPEKTTVLIYPNPSDNMINIISENEINKIEIYDLLGKKIDVFQLQSNQIQLRITDYNSGFYMLKIHSKGKIITEKFLKK